MDAQTHQNAYMYSAATGGIWYMYSLLVPAVRPTNAIPTALENPNMNYAHHHPNSAYSLDPAVEFGVQITHEANLKTDAKVEEGREKEDRRAVMSPGLQTSFSLEWIFLVGAVGGFRSLVFPRRPFFVGERGEEGECLEQTAS